MKQVFKAFSINLFFIIIFVSCSGLFDNKNIEAQTGNSIKVAGSISLENSARSAIALAKDITWTVIAEKESETINASVDGSTFSISLPAGSWTLTAKGNSPDGLAYEGSKEVTVDLASKPEAVSITVQLAEGNGKIALEINDQSGLASKVLCKLDSQTEITADFSANKAFLEKDSIPAGAYEALLSFYDSYSSLIYKCNEVITVNAALTTDTWEEAGTYITEGKFTLTQNLINSYLGTKHETPTVMWNKKTRDNEKTYIKGLQIFGNAVTSDTGITRPISCSTIEYAVKSWCFDDENNFYVWDGNNYIRKYKKTLNDYYVYYEECAKPVIQFTSGGSSDYVYQIKYVSLFGSKYLVLFYGYSSSCSKIDILDISNWNEENTLSSSGDCVLSFSTNDDNLNLNVTGYNEQNYFAIKDNKIYILGSREKIYAFILEKNENVLTLTQDTSFGTDGCITLADNLFPDKSNGIHIGDMFVNNDKLYILISLTGNGKFEYLNASQNYEYFYSSTGGILCVNLNNYSFESWADGSKLLGCYTENREGYKSNNDSESTMLTLAAIPPASESSKYFYGPKKIVAIKPDEIVIADDGWEYDGSSETSLKERNRLVTVSLKTWAIKSVLDVNVMFDSYIAPSSGWHLEK